MNEIPNHIAIIMDGNRRWAENKKINKINGHKKGIEIAKNIAIESHKIGVKNLTLYAFSFQNWNRPKIEVESLFKLFNDLFEDKSKFFKDNGFEQAKQVKIVLLFDFFSVEVNLLLK